jgi:membrane protease YdiL (CAAX protease family)
MIGHHPLRGRDLPEVNWVVVALVLAWTAAVMVFANSYYVPGGVYRILFDGTDGLLSATLQVCLPATLVVLAIIRFVGRFNFASFGFRKSAFVRGVKVAAIMWLLLNFWAAYKSFTETGSIGLSELWRNRPDEALGVLAGQFLGNALFEETVFRGFLLAQFYAAIRTTSGRDDSSTVLKTVLIVGVLFMLEHVPNRIMKGDQGGELLGELFGIYLAGLLWSWMYVRTGNLFFTIAAHALHNYPTLVMDMPGGDRSAKVTATMLAILIAWMWPRLFRNEPGDLSRSDPPVGSP